MYVHVGNGKMINSKSMICILDMDVVTCAKDTVQWLSIAEKKGATMDIGKGLPKAVVVTNKTVYFVNIAVQTIKKRIDMEESGVAREYI